MQENHLTSCPTCRRLGAGLMIAVAGEPVSPELYLLAAQAVDGQPWEDDPRLTEVFGNGERMLANGERMYSAAWLNDEPAG